MFQEIFYKIQNLDSLFSKGGSHPRFEKRGKIWRSLGALRNHLNQLQDQSIYQNCSILKLETSVVEMISVTQEIKGSLQRKQDKLDRIEIQAEEARRNEEINQLHRLKAKYGDA